MDDFIRPVKQPEEKPKRKKSFFRETIVILLIIACLGIGFAMGYVSKNSNIVNNVDNNGVLDEAYKTLEEYWFNASDQEVNVSNNGIKSLVSGLGDPYSDYWTSEEAEEFNASVNGNYEGIGVSFSMVSNGALIIKVFENAPAKTAGLKVGDIINKADGVDLSGKDSEAVKKLVRGNPGTSVKLTVISEGNSKEVEVVRESLDTAVVYEVRENNGKKFGYIQITTFGTTTASDVEAALKVFEEQGVSTLVLDLRDNGGGYLNAAIDLLNLFFNEGDVIYKMQKKGGPVEETKATGGNKYHFVKGYILVNGNSASASELVSGAMQETLKYELVGTKTYGKGTAQTQQTLSDGSVLKYTYAKWMTPSGFCVHGKGLTPDIEVANYNLNDIKIGEIKEAVQFDQVSEHVVSMQKMLKILGYDCGRVDGYFSTQTVEMLKQFETKFGLNVDGIYSNSDYQILVGQVMIYSNDSVNDLQYHKLLEIIK